MFVALPDRERQYAAAREVYTAASNSMEKDDMAQFLSTKWSKEKPVVAGFLEGKVAGDSVEFKKMKELARDWEMFVRGANMSKLSFGWRRTDQVTHGMRPADVITFMAMTSVGKTMWAEQLMLNVSRLHPDVPILFFSLEQMGIMAFQRMMQMEGRLTYEEVEKWLDPADAVHCNKMVTSLETLLAKTKNLHVVDKSPMTIDDIDDAVARFNLRSPDRKAGLVVIDYLGFISAEPGQSQYEAVSKIARWQKSVLAKKHTCAVVSLHQLSKQGQGGGIPVEIGMARDSGVVIESADIVIGAWRPGLRNDITESQMALVKNVFRTKILKNRYGPSGAMIDFDFTDKYLVLDEKESNASYSDEARRKSESKGYSGGYGAKAGSGWVSGSRMEDVKF
jgi:replicative DNA helicase